MERYGGSAGVPLYTDESTPVPKSHIRTTPASPQWQRKLELPLRIILACINASTDHTATTRLTVLWKTLTIMQPQADDDFHEDCIAWARLFYFQENDKFVGKLEVVDDLAQIMEGPPINDTTVKSLWEEKWNEPVWGNQYELDRAEQEAFQKLQSEAKPTGKSIAKGKPSKHWTNTMIWNSYWSPYPFQLRLTKVDGVHFCWDELCDKKKRSDLRVNDFKLCTVQGKPVAQSRSSS